MYAQVVEALHAKGDESDAPLKPLEAMLSIDLAHPNIIHTYKFYTRIRQVCPASYLLSHFADTLHVFNDKGCHHVWQFVPVLWTASCCHCISV